MSISSEMMMIMMMTMMMIMMMTMTMLIVMLVAVTLTIEIVTLITNFTPGVISERTRLPIKSLGDTM